MAESQDIRIGIDVYLTPQTQQTIASLRELATNLQAISNILPYLSGGLKKGATATEQFAGAGSDLLDIAKWLGQRFFGIRVSAQDLDTAVSQLSQRLSESGITAGEFKDIVSLLATDLRGLGEAGKEEQGVLETGAKRLYEAALGSAVMEQRLKELRFQSRATAAILGPYGRVLTELTRDTFWLALGTMFSVMGYARLQRTALTAESASLSYMRALQGLRDAQEAYNDALAVGYPEEVTRRALDLREATMAVKVAEDRIYETTIMNQLAGVMFWSGMIPTFIRASSDYSLAIIRLIASKELLTYSTLANMIAEEGWNAVISVSLPLLGELNVHLWMIVGAVSALTMGLPLLVMFFSQIAAQRMAEERIKGIREEFEKLSGSISLPRSPSLLEGLKETRTELGEIAKIGPRLNLGVSLKGPTLVQITGPVTIRSEEDIYALAREIDRLSRSEIYRMGVE